MPGPLPDTRPPAARLAGTCVSYTQHLLRELCADSPAPGHRLFLAAVTVHYSHENRNSSPYLVLPWDSTPGAGAAGDPGLGAPRHALPVELGAGQGYAGLRDPTSRGAVRGPEPGPARAEGLRGRHWGLGSSGLSMRAWKGVCLAGPWVLALLSYRTHQEKRAYWGRMCLPFHSISFAFFFTVKWLVGPIGHLLK